MGTFLEQKVFFRIANHGRNVPPARKMNDMARKKQEKELQPNIKVRLDRRTVITVRDREKLEFWKSKYPALEVLED